MERRIKLRLAIIAMPILLAACGKAPSDLLITNHTDSLVQDFKVSNGSSEWDLGDIEPGQSVRFTEGLSGEGGPQFRWEWNGQLGTGQGCYFSAPDIASEGELNIIGTTMEVGICK